MKKIILILVLVLAGVGIWSIYNERFVKNEDNMPTDSVLCIQDAKQCSDGSYVSRRAPTCEFAECPTTQIKDENVAALNQRILNAGVYITPLQVVADSRCPIDVSCVWAGEITVKVKLEKDTVSKEVELKEGGTTIFEGSNVSLVAVTPARNSKIPTLAKDYRFTFKVAAVISKGNLSGYVAGHVTIGPLCPVEGLGHPCEANFMDAWTSREVVIYKNDGVTEKERVHLDTQGNFKIALNPGTYFVQIQPAGIGPGEKKNIIITSKKTSTVNFDIDTGIR